MSQLTIHPEDRPEQGQVFTAHSQIAEALAELGVTFERWQAEREFGTDADTPTILSAYREPIDRLKATHGFQSADVISVGPDHPQKDELRRKFLNEHVHADFEVRFFVEGSGLFFLHPDQRVFVVQCERGDLISVPAGVKHWFDMGEQPHLKCIRLFTTPDGWVAEFTGDDIAKRFPTFDEYRARYAS
jgi:1,2-dihydroxy-3-keto-5-methylthiopentene dioxygenase